MATITDIRDRLRIDLHDPDGERWNDSALDRHIARALGDITNAIPREASTTLATTPGSRELSLAGISGLVQVEAVEYPVDRYPPVYVGFSHWEDTLSLHTENEPSGGDARIFYTAAHELDGTGTTLPAHLEDVLATGAAAYAVLEQATGATDALTTGDDVSETFAAQGRAWMSAFRELLYHHGRRNRVRGRRLYVPA
ncbi:MAG: hypothetical protein U5Q44_10590 [Dehalococcoidia bacterium]|nr:hypothetical protein [Dehalococcoidia bacterium]